MGWRECVRTIRDKWHFGKRWRTKDITGKFNGFSAPLWVNSAPNHFLFLSIWGAMFFIGSLLAYVLYIADQTECTFQMKGIIIAQISIVGFNTVMDIRYYFINQASDEEWSRYMFYLTLQILMNLISVFFGYFAAFATYSQFKDEHCFDDDQVVVPATQSNLWKTNISITSNVFLIMIGKSYVLSLMIKRFYSNTHRYLAFRITKEEDT